MIDILYGTPLHYYFTFTGKKVTTVYSEIYIYVMDRSKLGRHTKYKIIILKDLSLHNKLCPVTIRLKLKGTYVFEKGKSDMSTYGRQPHCANVAPMYTHVMYFSPLANTDATELCVRP